MGVGCGSRKSSIETARKVSYIAPPRLSSAAPHVIGSPAETGVALGNEATRREAACAFPPAAAAAAASRPVGAHEDELFVEHHDNVSVVFVDVVGFTTSAWLAAFASPL